MAYDPTPEDTADWIPVGRGPGSTFAKPSREFVEFWKQHVAALKGYVKIDSDLRKVFKDDRSVNLALRRWLENQEMSRGKRRKSA